MALTYLLFNVESLIVLARPSVLGLAINGMLGGAYGGLALLVAQHLGWLLVSTARQVYDTRAFTAIYADTACRLVDRQRRAGVAVSTVAARSALARELVDFFEHDLKAVIIAVYGVGGALTMLVAYDPGVAGLCLLLLGPVALLGRRLAGCSLALNAALNDQLEREVEAIEDGRPGTVLTHYRLVARHRVRLSDLEAGNFFATEFLVLGLIGVALARYCSRPHVHAGDIYAVFAYVEMFVNGLGWAPIVIGQLARLRDIGERVARGDDGGDGPDEAVVGADPAAMPLADQAFDPTPPAAT